MKKTERRKWRDIKKTERKRMNGWNIRKKVKKTGRNKRRNKKKRINGNKEITFIIKKEKLDKYEIEQEKDRSKGKRKTTRKTKLIQQSAE